jgi:hypothetical protein
VEHGAVHDRTAVEVDADRARRWPRDRGLSRESAHDKAADLGVPLLELEQFRLEFSAEDIERALGGLGGRREVEQAPSVRAQLERNRGVRERERLDHIGHASRLGRVRLEELPPRRHVEEERPHLDRRAGPRGRRTRAAQCAALDLDLRAA